MGVGYCLTAAAWAVGGWGGGVRHNKPWSVVSAPADTVLASQPWGSRAVPEVLEPCSAANIRFLSLLPGDPPAGVGWEFSVKPTFTEPR